MANFGDNPFGDPEPANPFGGSPRPSQFITPTPVFVPSPTTIPLPSPVRAPAAYNDFSTPLNFYEDNSQARPPAYGAMVTSPGAPPPYLDNARLNTDELRRRQEELEKKAAELDRREAEIRNSPYNPKQNNFPPVPKFCCFGPCFYQDFEVDIPLGYKAVVKSVFYLWIAYTALLTINVIACVAYLGVYGSGAAMTFGLSLLWVVLFPPLSFVAWYRPAYKAFRSDSSLSFFIFFCNCGAQVGVNILQALGINACGTSGVINGLSMITTGGLSNVGVGAFMLILGVAFAVQGAACLFILGRIHRIYRSTGASFQKAQQEFATRAMTNEHVQNAAVNVARNHVQESLSSSGTSGRF